MVFVGEPTGGKPKHFGQVSKMRLPHSKTPVRYSTKPFTNSPDDTAAFEPDVLVKVPSGEYFAGRDPCLERILAHRRRLPSAFVPE